MTRRRKYKDPIMQQIYEAEMERRLAEADSVVAHLVIDREWLRKTDDPEIAAWANAAIARHNARQGK